MYFVAAQQKNFLPAFLQFGGGVGGGRFSQGGAEGAATPAFVTVVDAHRPSRAYGRAYDPSQTLPCPPGAADPQLVDRLAAESTPRGAKRVGGAPAVLDTEIG